MRLFVYLLALLTGLSAAQSAEARHASPAALDVASAILDAGEQEASREFAVVAVSFSALNARLADETAAPKIDYDEPARLPVVYRGDRSRE